MSDATAVVTLFPYTTLFRSHVGEDDDGLGPCAGLVEELRALDQPAGDVGVGGSSHRLDVSIDLVFEGALLGIRLRRPRVEGGICDDVLFAEGAPGSPRDPDSICRRAMCRR